MSTKHAHIKYMLRVSKKNWQLATSLCDYQSPWKISPRKPNSSSVQRTTLCPPSVLGEKQVLIEHIDLLI